jgi:hypothetical protein
MTAERHGSDAVAVAGAPLGRIVFSNREASQVENRGLLALDRSWFMTTGGCHGVPRHPSRRD